MSVPGESSRDEVSHVCPSCSRATLQPQLVKSAIWHDDRLIVIEDIPALVCSGCGERFFDDSTTVTLDLMQAEGFPADHARAHVHVPIFRFGHRVPPELVAALEVDA